MKFCVFNILVIKFCKNLMVCRVLYFLFIFSIYNLNLFSVKNDFIIFMCIFDIKIKYRIKKVGFFFFYSCFSRICGKFFRGVYIVRKEIVIKENIFFFLFI